LPRNLSQSDVEGAIQAEVIAHGAQAVGTLTIGIVIVLEVAITHHAYTVDTEWVNVGTYFLSP